MPNYRRANISGASYFFTVNLLERESSLLIDEIILLRESVKKVKDKYPFEINAWVVLPDHMHTVWTLPPGDCDFPVRWRLIKTHFSRALPCNEKINDNRLKRSERGIWQRRYWEHLIRNESDYKNHIEYCYINPVKHGHVSSVKEWPYSSFHRDVKKGIFPENWAGEDTIFEGGFGE